MKAEEKALWSRRKEVTIALHSAAAEGDRSENAESIPVVNSSIEWFGQSTQMCSSSMMDRC